MGLYDKIQVKDKLQTTPELDDYLSKHSINLNKQEFQTKDLDNFLYNYLIENGQIFKNIVSDHSGDITTMVDLGDKKDFKKQQDITLNLRFYTFLNSDEQDCSLDYKAKILDGNILSITLEKCEFRDAKFRLDALKDLLNRLEAENVRSKKLWYKIYKYLYKIPLRWILKNGLWKPLNYLSRKQYKIDNFLFTL